MARTIVSRQLIDGANPGVDVIIGSQLRELLMRDIERAIYAVLSALATKYTIADTAGTGASQSGRDLVRGLNAAIADYYAVTRLLPAEGIHDHTNDWANLVAGEDSNWASHYAIHQSGQRCRYFLWCGIPAGSHWRDGSCARLGNHYADAGIYCASE